MSRLTNESAKVMTDEQWLGAIKDYAGGARQYDPDGWLVMSQETVLSLFEQQVRLQPDRFIGLALQVRGSPRRSYLEATLRGVAEVVSGINQDLLWDLFTAADALTGRPVGRAICWCLQRAAALDVPDSVVAMVTWYATQDPDPAEDLWREDRTGGSFYGGSVEGAGMNSSRGSAALAIGALIRAKPERLNRLRATLESLVRDPSVSVRACAAGAVGVVVDLDSEFGFELFGSLIDSDDRLLGTSSLQPLLSHVAWVALDRYRELFQRMMRSEYPEVHAAVGRALALASLENEAARPLLSKALTLGTQARVGAALVFATNVRSPKYRDWSAAQLIPLFDDEDEAVQDAVLWCWRELNEEERRGLLPLLEAFTASRAFARQHHDVLRLLEQSTGDTTRTILLVVDRIAEQDGDNLGNIQTAAAADADRVTNLVLRAYTQSAGDPDLQARCLDLIDRLAAHGAMDLDEALSEYERIAPIS